MCFGSTNKAADAAAAEEKRRQAGITSGQRRLEGIFSSPQREQQVQDFIAAQRAGLQSDLNREHGTNSRDLKFSLARSGLSGGSTDVDQNRLLSETFLRGTAEAERRAQNSGAGLRADDQATKQQLFAQLLGGGDITTAATNAAQSIRNNTALARQDGTFNAFDNLFGDVAKISENSREAAGERRASQEFGSLFGPRPRTQAQVAGGLGG